MANLKHTTGVRSDGQSGGTYGTGPTAPGRQPAYPGITYDPNRVRQYPEALGGVSTD